MKKYWPIFFITFAGLLLRLYHFTSISLWHDEAFSALMIRYPWGEMFTRLGLDVHPPMYYIFLRFWHYVFGDSIASLRGFSVFFGVLTVPAVWLFVKTAFKSPKMALWAALLVALNPFQINYVTEARMYTMGAFFSVLAAYFLVKALHTQKQYFEDQKLNMPHMPEDIKLRKIYIWNYLGFVICTAIIILTHYYLLFTAAALCFYALVYHVYHYRALWRRYLSLVTCYLLLVAAFLPWLKTFLWQLKSVSGSYWIPAMDIWSIPGTLWTMLLGINHDNNNSFTQKMLVLVSLFSIYFFWRVLKKNQMFEKWLLLLCTIAPFCGAILFVVMAHLKGSSSSVYEERYFLYASTFYIIALAAWLAEIKFKQLGAVLLTAYCLFNVYAFFHYWNGFDIGNKPGMGGAANYLTMNASSADHIFLGSSFEFFNFKYYWTASNGSTGDLPQGPWVLDAQTNYHFLSNVRPLLFTGGRSDISQMSSVEGLALLSNADLAPTFTQYAHTGDTEWLVWTNGFGSHKPDMPANWTQVVEKEYQDVRPYVGTSIFVDEYKVN